MGACQTPDPVLHGGSEVRMRDIIPCLRYYRRNCRKDIFYAMVEFGNQHIPMLFDLLAFRDVNSDADYPTSAPAVVIRDNSPQFDPSNFATRTNDTILHRIFALALAESFASEHLNFFSVLWIQTG